MSPNRRAHAIVGRLDHRDERIVIETSRYRITGVLRLPHYLNASERAFLALTDVDVASLDGPPRGEHRDFLALSLRHIVLAMPADGSQS
jgi:hypothetical protein